LKDEVGLNKGLNDLATGAEISAYFDDVMRHRFLPTGRVQYFPMCDYQGDGGFVSALTGEHYQVSARKTVDVTYLKTSVPATHTPSFSIADGVRFMPLNDPPKVTGPPEGYVVIGGGKTGIDACLWLLENGVDPDLFDRPESAGVLLRIISLEQNQIVLEQGRVAVSANHLHIDCSASAISNLDTKPIFKGDRITPQAVRSYQPVFSAAWCHCLITIPTGFG
jgi:hypothetical protein